MMYRLIHQEYGCKIPVMAQPTSPRMVTSTWTVPAYLPMQCLESRAQKCEPKDPALHGKRP